LFTTLM